PHLPGHGLPRRHVRRALRHRQDGGLGCAVGGDAPRSRAEDLPAATALHGPRSPQLRPDGRKEGMIRSIAVAMLLAGVAVGAAAQAPPAFDSTRAYGHVREQVALGPRPAGSAANQKTRDFIIK